MRRLLLFLIVTVAASAAAVPVDRRGYRPGPVEVEVDSERIRVAWRDERNQPWLAVFSLDPAGPLIESIASGDRIVVSGAQPFYRGETGKRRRGWNAFFDFPPSHPESTRRAQTVFAPSSARVTTRGNRVEVYFDGLRMGLFEGGLAYTFFAGARLIQQEARLTTDEPDVAYYYDAGLDFSGAGDRRPGGNMSTAFAYYDTDGKLQRHVENGLQPERIPVKVRYRTLAVDTPGGSVAVFPAPHQYFFPRDFTSNLGYLWHRSRRGRVGLGIRQIGDTNWGLYPWVNAPPGSLQRMSVFFQLSTGEPEQVLDDVLAYTRRDRFARLDGYRTVSSHWHLAYTVQAMEHGFDWEPPFKPVLEQMGVDASIIMDFHGDGHPRDLGDLRLRELDAFFRACRTQSDEDFLLIPAEEANVHLGGHWAVVFPKPVYWHMNRPPGGRFETAHPEYGTVYSTADAAEMLRLARLENGLIYQTHARTKGSTGYPDKIREKDYFRDPHYFGAGWKAMPSDLSSPRLGDRVFTLLDDMNDWGLPKRTMGEVDVFQFDQTHELYAHMNINYVQADRLPPFDEYGEILKPIAAGDFFVTTGEVLLPQTEIDTASADEIRVSAEVQWTLPLSFGEIIWSDGSQVHRHAIPLDHTTPHGAETFEWRVRAKGWKWARVAVWDIAADGAFVNPVYRK